MRTIIPLLCLLWSQEAPFSDKDAEEAIKKMKASFEGASIEKRAAAVQEALGVEHEKVIRAVGEVFFREPNPVRVAAARALGEVDHPASVEVLLKALPANQNRAEVMPEIVKALGKLGYQSACPALHEYVKRVGDPDVRLFLPDVVEALGRLGSATSIDPLVDLLRKMETGRRAWVNEGELIRVTERALRAITGQDFRRALDWDNYWRQNSEFLKAGMIRTYWIRKTQLREDVSGAEKAPPDSVLVAARLVPAQVDGNGSERQPRRRRRDR